MEKKLKQSKTSHFKQNNRFSVRIVFTSRTIIVTTSQTHSGTTKRAKHKMGLLAFEPFKIGDNTTYRTPEVQLLDERVGIMTNIRVSTDVFYEFRVDTLMLPNARELFLMCMEFTTINAPLLETIVCCGTSHKMDDFRESRIQIQNYPCLKKIVLLGCSFFDITTEQPFTEADKKTLETTGSCLLDNRVTLFAYQGSVCVNRCMSHAHVQCDHAELCKASKMVYKSNDWTTRDDIDLDSLFQSLSCC